MINLGDPQLHTLFYVQVSASSNWMGVVFERPEGTELLYRMHYIKDNKSWPETEDELNWYRCGPGKQSIPYMLNAVRIMLQMLMPLADGKLIEITRRDKTESEFAAAVMNIPGVRVTPITSV